jgi:hypothetical protein
VRAHTTTNGWIYKKKLARKFKARARARAFGPDQQAEYARQTLAVGRGIGLKPLANGAVSNGNGTWPQSAVDYGQIFPASAVNSPGLSPDGFYPVVDKAFDPNEPRDDHGRWTSGGDSGAQHQDEATGGRHVGGKERATTGGRYGEDRTQRFRVATRGQMRVDAAHASARYHTPDAWERRRLSSLPGAQFDAQGRLSNVEEMRAVARRMGLIDKQITNEDMAHALIDVFGIAACRAAVS